MIITPNWDLIGMSTMVICNDLLIRTKFKYNITHPSFIALTQHVRADLILIRSFALTVFTPRDLGFTWDFIVDDHEIDPRLILC